MRHKHLLVGLVLGTVLLTGCGSKMNSITENTIIIEKDGTISDVSVEDYSTGNYDMAGLEAFINDEIADYNSEAGDGSVVLEKLDTESELVKLQLSYSDIEDYNAFNNTDYVIEGLSAANLSGEFTSVSSGSQVRVADMTETDLQVLKVKDAIDIVCKGKVLYYNGNVTEENGTYTASGNGEAVIVFK